MKKKRQQQNLRNWAIFIVVFLFVVLLVISFSGFYFTTHPNNVVSKETPLDYGYAYEDVEFKSTDGLTLRGWFLENKESDKAIIVMHGYPYDKGDVGNFSYFLNKDYNLLLFDFRSFGFSDGEYTTLGWEEEKDVKGAIRYLNDRGFEKIGIHAFSMGAVTALMADIDVVAIVADSPYCSLSMMLERKYTIPILRKVLVFFTDLFAKVFLKIDISNMSACESVKNVEIPILLMHEKDDTYVPAFHSLQIHNNAKNSEYWVVEGNKHAMLHNDYPEEYEKKVSEFFNKHLK